MGPCKSNADERCDTHTYTHAHAHAHLHTRTRTRTHSRSRVYALDVRCNTLISGTLPRQSVPPPPLIHSFSIFFISFSFTFSVPFSLSTALILSLCILSIPNTRRVFVCLFAVCLCVSETGYRATEGLGSSVGTQGVPLWFAPLDPPSVSGDAAAQPWHSLWDRQPLAPSLS